MRSSLHKLVLLIPLLSLAGCKAGPSAFDRKGGSGASAQANQVTGQDSASTTAVVPAGNAREGDTTLVSDTARSDTRMSVQAPATDGSGGPHVAEDRVPPARDSVQDHADAPLHFERPEHVRGLYLNAWVAGSARRVDTLLALAGRTEINTFVIDIKDATGYVSEPTKVPLAVAAGADGEVRIHDLHGLLVKLKRAGVYPIARIVVIKDPILAKYRPDLAVQDTAGGVWVDDKGIVWLNLFNKDVWKYQVQLAEEVASYGFPEIQWDYVRFPDAPESDLARAVFPDSAGITKPQAIRDFLEYSRKALAKKGVLVTADVFGVTASASRDVGIGQVWKSFIDVVDVAQPMVYPSHYWEGSFGFETPNAYPYQVVRHALRDALRQSSEVKGAGATRPWLQDFTLGKPPYGAAEVRAEIQATYDTGIEEWILWNPSSHYTEGALEPVGGFKSEPFIRVGGEIVPVSERFQVLGEDENGRPLPVRDTTRDSLGAGPDSLDAERHSLGALLDSLGTAPDSLGVLPDSFGGFPDSLATTADTSGTALR